jgi:peptide/nickel transport system ATP-binding protein
MPDMRLVASMDAPLRHHGVKDKQARRERILAMFNRVGLEEAISLSGARKNAPAGQLQRMVIARAVLLEPKFLL